MFNLTSIHDTCYRRCSTWCPSIAMHPSATPVTIQYLFPRCLPCLSRRWTHNLTYIHDTCYRRCSMWHPSIAMHPSATTVTIQYLFPLCLPCLSRRRTHNQTSSATMDKCTDLRLCPNSIFPPRCLPCLSRRMSHNQMSSATMDKCADLRKYAFPDPCLLEFFSCVGVYYYFSKYSILF